MAKVTITFTEIAYADLEDIESYISQDSPAISRKFISRIFDRIDQLYNYPTSGKFVPEVKDPHIRELLLNKYRIIYRLLNESEVQILRIVHGSRLLDIDF